MPDQILKPRILRPLTILFCLFFLGSCARKDELELAREYAAQSEVKCQHAGQRYKALIRKGKDLKSAHFELGRLYYSHGEFEKAIDELRLSGHPAALGLEAIAQYHLGNFTDALSIFNKNNSDQGEYLYYYGLTCEKLNLFDRALETYKKITDLEFKPLASERIKGISSHASADGPVGLNHDIAKMIQDSPGQDQFPQAGGLVLLCDEKIEITAENTQTVSLHYLIKILNERGKENFSEAHIEYDSTYEKVELEYARTIRKDGNIADVGASHIRDVSKYMNFPLYSNARVYIISFPEIADGAFIEYKVRIHRSELVNKKDFATAYPLQSSEPIIKADFNLIMPAGRKLNLKTINEDYNNFGAAMEPKIKEESGRKTYLWQFHDIPQIIPETNMPANVKINPAVLISTFNSWQEVYQWWYALAKDRIKADLAIKQKVKELIRGRDTPEAKARAIYNFCAKEIRYVAVEYGDAGYQPHSAPEIFRNKYGDCKDQAVLLVTMLREANIPSWPVLIPTKECFNLAPDFAWVLFDHCIAAAQPADEMIFLDPTSQTCSFGDLPIGDQDRRVLVVKEDRYEIKETPLYSPAHNLLQRKAEITLNSDDSVKAKKDIFSFGFYDQAQRYWLLYTPPQLVEEALKKEIQGFSIGAVLEGYEANNVPDLDKPVILSYKLRGPEYLTAAGDLRIMPQLSGVDTSLVAYSQRRYPIEFSALNSQESTLRIKLPEGFMIRYMPDNVREDGAWFKFSAEYSLQDDTLFFSEKTEIKKNIISQQEYPRFKVFYENLAKKVKQRVVLEKIK
jgi:tetratricopeptide (TPR) repeat protein